jgi:Aldehyde dehydrogenase family
MNKVEFSRTAKLPFAKRYGNFIGGKFAEPRSGRYFDNLSPVNGKLLCEIGRSNEQDIEAALDAAHAAKDGWGRTSVAERAVILNKIVDRMRWIVADVLSPERIHRWGHRCIAGSHRWRSGLHRRRPIRSLEAYRSHHRRRSRARRDVFPR